MTSSAQGLGAATAELGSTFENFYLRERDGLTRSMYLLTGSAADAEELVQEAMLRIYERWSRVRRMSSPSAYLYTTALNLQRSRLRRLVVQARTVLRHDRAEVDPAEQTEQRNEALEALMALPPGLREALVLVEFQGLSVEEAASVLRIKPVSFRGQLHRARRALEEMFGGTDG
jgi:RNA polymerase sigma factor (sigma-70 family)